MTCKIVCEDIDNFAMNVVSLCEHIENTDNLEKGMYEYSILIEKGDDKTTIYTGVLKAIIEGG